MPNHFGAASSVEHTETNEIRPFAKMSDPQVFIFGEVQRCPTRTLIQ
jgi:hypothetical protein